MIYLDGPHFRDEKGRTIMLRGVNLGGSNKLPYTPKLSTHTDKTFYEKRNISFVNRPFPLQEADEHFKRLAAWGLHCIRLVVTWEAIEPQEPGRYDLKFLEYIHGLIQKGKEYDFNFFIDFHQDVWSRFSGGDGAPRWTFEKVGLDISQFAETGAAILHNDNKNNYEYMVWPTNYTKLACATMFTLFFGGNDFAPLTKIEGVPVQDYLQSHFLNAAKKLAEYIKNLDNIIGFEAMNEPSPGWIGWEDLHSNQFMLRKGVSPSPFQAIIAGAGHTVTAEKWQTNWLGSKKVGKTKINPKGVKAWLNGRKCIWKENGIWGEDHLNEPKLLKPDHFSVVNGKKINFAEHYLLPFVNRFAAEIRSVIPQAIIFMEPPLQEEPPQLSKSDAKDLVFAPHWYDVTTLFMRKYFSWMAYDLRRNKIVFGKKNIKNAFNTHLGEIKHQGIDLMGGAPTLIGESGVPFNISNQSLYKKNYNTQVQALDRIISAFEQNLLHYTIWNYTADNNKEYGDHWNEEDLSIFCKDDINPTENDVYSGGRALKAIIRPYPLKTAGLPVLVYFDLKKQYFEFQFKHQTKVDAPTEIFIPSFHYPNGFKTEISDGTYTIDKDKQMLYYHHSNEKELHIIKIHKQ